MKKFWIVFIIIAVLISAGLLEGRKAVAAWSMVDDLIYAGATHDPEARGIRDGRLATGRFPFDLPVFCSLVLEAFAAVENRPVPDGYGERLRGKTIGIVVDEATNGMQTFYPQYRIQEEMGSDAVVATVFPDDNKKYLSTDLLRDELEHDIHALQLRTLTPGQWRS